MVQKQHRLWLIIGFLFFNTFLLAQPKPKLEYSGFFDSYYYRGPVSFTLAGGVSGYNGDLCGGLDCNKIGYAFGIGANYKMWPRTVFGLEFNYFTLGATDELATRNISFTSTNYSLSAYGRFYFIDDIVRVAADRRRKLKKVKPYVTLGFGALVFNPVSQNINLPIDTTSENYNYPGFTAIMPVGFGIQYVITPKVSLIGEVTYTQSISDYLDDVGKVRGNNSGLKDGYAFVQLKLQYTPKAPMKKKKKVFSGPSNGGGGSGAAEGGEEAESTNDGKGSPGMAPPPADTTNGKTLEAQPELPEQGPPSGETTPDPSLDQLQPPQGEKPKE